MISSRRVDDTKYERLMTTNSGPDDIAHVIERLYKLSLLRRIHRLKIVIIV